MNMMAMTIGHNGGPSIYNDPRIEIIQQTALRRDLSAAEKMVYIGLLTARAVNTVVQASTTTLKDYASATDRKTVYAATRALEKLGLIRKTKAAGRQNTYSALPPNVVNAVADAYHALKDGSKVVPKNGTTQPQPVPSNGTTTSAEKRHQYQQTAPLPVPPDGTTFAETSAVERHLSEVEKKKGLPHTPSKEKLPLKITNTESVSSSFNRQPSVAKNQTTINWSMLNPHNVAAAAECAWVKNRLEVAGEFRAELLAEVGGDEIKLRAVLDAVASYGGKETATGLTLQRYVRSKFSQAQRWFEIDQAKLNRGKPTSVKGETPERRVAAILESTTGKQMIREMGYEKAKASIAKTLEQNS